MSLSKNELVLAIAKAIADDTDCRGRGIFEATNLLDDYVKEELAELKQERDTFRNLTSRAQIVCAADLPKSWHIDAEQALDAAYERKQKYPRMAS